MEIDKIKYCKGTHFFASYKGLSGLFNIFYHKRVNSYFLAWI